MAAVLECRDLRKGFGGIPVLNGVSLVLEHGTVTALAGENGAGKSTLMKIASGQYRADSGTVTVDGSELRTGSMAQITERNGDVARRHVVTDRQTFLEALPALTAENPEDRRYRPRRHGEADQVSSRAPQEA